MISIFRFYVNSYASCKHLDGMHEQGRWLALAAPLLLQLVVRYQHSKKLWGSFKGMLPRDSCSLLKAVAATISCLPMTSRASPTPDKYLPMQRWLQQHPQHLAAVQAAVSSPGVSWFLWSFAAAFTGRAAEVIGHKAPADGSQIMADHEPLLEYSANELKLASGLEVRSCLLRLLSCLSHLHLHLPADQVLRDLVDIRKQQQEDKASDSGSSSSSSRSSGAGNSGSSAGADTGHSTSRGANSLGTSGDSGSSGAAANSSSHEESSRTTSLLQTAAGTPGCSVGGEDDVAASGRDLGLTRGVVQGQAAAGQIRAGSAGTAAAEGGAAAPNVPLDKMPGTSSAPADVVWLFTVLSDKQAISATFVPRGLAGRGQTGESIASSAVAREVLERSAPPVAAAAAREGPWQHCPQPISLDQVKLFLELLLSSWPAEGKPRVSLCWDMLLLLVGLVQQASVEVRRQLMQQRGVMVLQLLYHVLLDDEAFGGSGITAEVGHPIGCLGLLVTGLGSTAWPVVHQPAPARRSRFHATVGKRLLS